MNWTQVKESATDIAGLAEERFQRHGLVLVSTLRRDGWPCISPGEPLIVDGVLYLGMSWRSRKALDLLRDPRITVQTIVSNKDGTEGEVKLYGHAEDVRSAETRRTYLEAVRREMGYELSEGEEFHLFAVDYQSAAYVVIEDGEQKVRVWPYHWSVASTKACLISPSDWRGTTVHPCATTEVLAGSFKSTSP